MKTLLTFLLLTSAAIGQTTIKTVTLEDLTKKGIGMLGEIVKVKFNDRDEIQKERAEGAGKENVAAGFYTVLYTYPDRDYKSYSISAYLKSEDGLPWLEKLPVFDERDYSKTRLKVNFVYAKVAEATSGSAMLELLGVRQVMGGGFDWKAP
jgi:hypothetical protein